MKDRKDNLVMFDNGMFRVTCVSHTWSGSSGIRVQMKQANGRLHCGPEIPLEVVPELLQAMNDAFVTLMIFQVGSDKK